MTGIFATWLIFTSHVVCCASWNWEDMQHYVVPSDEPEELTCWTCPNKANNEACNDWAPDHPCTEEFSVCKTVHHMDPYSASSVSVSKSCASKKECTAEDVGCRLQAGVVRCVSCCNEDYCNEAAPLNGQHALDMSAAVLFNGADTSLRVLSSASMVIPLSVFIFGGC